MKVTIRNMQMEDIDAVCAMENAVFSDAWSKNGFIESLENDKVVLLTAVSEENHVVGYCCLYSVMDEGEIVNVAVHPAKRQQGIGEMMVQQLIDTAKAQGVTNFYLEVRASNLPAQRLYGKLGFKTVGVRKNFYEKPVENALVMSLGQ